MKALEILEAITENEGTHLWLDDGSGYPKSYINEAIQELEALKNRSCENCKYCSFSDSSSVECDLFECYQQKALKYCGNWKPKND